MNPGKILKPMHHEDTKFFIGDKLEIINRLLSRIFA